MHKLIDKYNSLSKEIRASFWFLVCTVMPKAVSVLTTPIFTRILGTGDYGQYSVFISWMDIVAIFVTLRLYYGVYVRGLVKFSDDKERYSSSLQGLGLVLSAIWTIVYVLFRDFWNQLFHLTTVQMLGMLAMIWATGAFRFWAAAQRNEYRYRMLVIVTLLVSISGPVLGIFLVLHVEDKATARILGLVIAELAVYSWLFVAQMRKGKTFCSIKYWKHALMFNIPLLPHYMSQAVLNSSDKIMIRDMVGVTEAGIYGLAYSLSRLMSMVNQAMVQTFSPWAYRKIKQNRATDLNSIAVTMLIMVASSNLLVIAFAPEIVHVFGPKAYYGAIGVIPPVAMSVYYVFSYNLFAVVEFYYEKTKMIMVASVLAAGLNILLNYIFIRIYGYYAAGYTTLFCYIIYSIGHYLFMRSVTRQEMGGIRIYNTKQLGLISIVFTGLGFLFLLTYSCDPARYALIAALAFVLVLAKKRIAAGIKNVIAIRKVKGKKAEAQKTGEI